MPQFYFHFHDGTSHSADDVGLEFADSDQAYLEAVAAARAMWPELLAKRTDPNHCAFFITDEHGAELFQVRFAELIDCCKGPSTDIAPHPVMVELSRSTERAREATEELRHQVGVSRERLAEASRLLRVLGELEPGAKRAAA